jgi:hypothetical protein
MQRRISITTENNHIDTDQPSQINQTILRKDTDISNSLITDNINESNDESSEDEESDEDKINQDDIIEEIDRIEDEMSKLNNQLKMMTAEQAANAKNLAESCDDADYNLLDDFQSRTLVPNTKSMSESDLIKKILLENRCYVRDVRQRQYERDSHLLNPDSDGRNSNQIFLYRNTSNVNMRAHLVNSIRKSKALAKHRETIIREKYDELQVVWKARIKRFESKASKLASQSRSSSSLLDDGGMAISRRRGMQMDGFVRSEAEFEKIIMNLDAPDETEKEKMMLRRCAIEPDMEINNNVVYRDTNNLIRDPAADLKAYNGRVDLIWSDAEKDIFKRLYFFNIFRNLVLFDKNFSKLASFLPHKSTMDCVQYFYREKINLRFKQLMRRNMQGHGRGRRPKELETPVVPQQFLSYVLNDNEEIEHLGSKWKYLLVRHREWYGTDGFEVHDEFKQDATNVFPGFTAEDEVKALKAFAIHGRDFKSVSRMMEGTMNEEKIRLFYNFNRKRERERDKMGLLGLSSKKPKKRGGPKSSNSSSHNVLKREFSELDDGSLDIGFGDSPGNLGSSFVHDDKKNVDLSEKKRKKSKTKDGLDNMNSIVDSPNSFDINNTLGIDGAKDGRKTISYWSVSERQEFIKAYTTYGKNWDQISKIVGTKSTIQVRNFYHNSRQKLKLDEIVVEDSGKNIKEKKSFLNEFSPTSSSFNVMNPTISSFNLISPTMPSFKNLAINHLEENVSGTLPRIVTMPQDLISPAILSGQNETVISPLRVGSAYIDTNQTIDQTVVSHNRADVTAICRPNQSPHIIHPNAYQDFNEIPGQVNETSVTAIKNVQYHEYRYDQESKSSKAPLSNHELSSINPSSQLSSSANIKFPKYLDVTKSKLTLKQKFPVSLIKISLLIKSPEENIISEISPTRDKNDNLLNLKNVNEDTDNLSLSKILKSKKSPERDTDLSTDISPEFKIEQSTEIIDISIGCGLSDSAVKDQKPVEPVADYEDVEEGELIDEKDDLEITPANNDAKID